MTFTTFLGMEDNMSTASALAFRKLGFRYSLSIFMVAGLICSLAGAANSTPVGKTVELGRKSLQIVFSGRDGSLVGINDIISGQQFIEAQQPPANLWKLRLVSDGDTVVIGPESARNFAYRFNNGDSTRVELEWRDFDSYNLRLMTVRVSVSLTNHATMSHWNISVNDFKGYVLDRIWFPQIGRIVPLEDERLLVPQWMGVLARQPRKVFQGASGYTKLEWSYPGEMSEQCVSVYSGKGPGLYLACDDTSGYRKSFLLKDDASGEISYGVENLPVSGAVGKGSYALPYDGVVGTFTGDWFTVAQIYRKWATSQIWCRESRFRKGKVPDWLLKTGMWEWNRGRSDVVLKPAAVLQDKLGLPVDVFWHWWHGCPYDAGFPEYFPPREGSKSFLDAISKAHTEGLHAILYMNQRLWGMTTKSWNADDAARYAVRNSDGKIESHVYNIFTDQPMASMCIATSFWRNTYSGLAARGINKYDADGIYMDQACTSLVCYDSTHGHPVGGGNYWISGFDSLTAQIRERNKSGRDILLAGEGCGENWLPYLDLFLTLQVSRERYARPDDGWDVIPFFQAVYHPYAVTYGNYSSLAYPPYDNLWPKKFRPRTTGKLLSKKFDTQFYLEQARSFVWGMEPTIANFSPFQLKARSKEMAYLFRIARTRIGALKYLLSGTMERPPQISKDSLSVPFSRVSIYAGQEGAKQSFVKAVPDVMIGAWKAEDGSMAFPIASVTGTRNNLNLHFTSQTYGLPDAGRIFVLRGSEKLPFGTYDHGYVTVDLHLAPLEVVVVEVESEDGN